MSRASIRYSISALRDIVERGTPPHFDCTIHLGGICANANLYGLPEYLVQRAFEMWPEYSGESDYPISITAMRPGEEYCNLPHWEGAQKEARLRLAQHLINYFKRYLENHHV